MFIPTFTHNLISVQKLAQEQKCKVMFLSDCYIIQDEQSEEVRRVGKVVRSVYHLIAYEKNLKMSEARCEARKARVGCI